MISLSSKLGLASLGVWVAFVGCGKTRDSEANVAGGSADVGTVGTAGKASKASTAGTAGELNGGLQVGTGGVGIVVPEISVAGAGGLPAQPTIDCGQAGGDSAGAGGVNSAEECASPPSVCADNRRLAYYSSGVCVAGVCRWTVETLYCSGGCARGSCEPPTTEK